MQVPDRRRVVIERIRPQVDGGRFPVKRVIGDEVQVEADVFADGHEFLVALLQHRHENETAWHEQPMLGLGNDRWRRSSRSNGWGSILIALWVGSIASTPGGTICKNAPMRARICTSICSSASSSTQPPTAPGAGRRELAGIRGSPGRAQGTGQPSQAAAMRRPWTMGCSCLWTPMPIARRLRFPPN